MNKINNFILLIALFIAGCYSYQHIDIEVLKPAPKTLSKDIENVVLLDQDNYSIQFQEKVRRKLSKKVKFQCKRLTPQLKQVIESSPKYTLVKIDSTRNFPKMKSKLKKLDDEMLTEIKKRTHAEGLVFVQSINFQLSQKKVLYKGTNYYETVDIMTFQTCFQFYDLRDKKMLDNYILKDSVRINPNYGIEEYTLKSRDLIDALKTSKKYIIQKYVQRISPYWDNQQRFYYAGHFLTEDAEKLMEKKEWKNAISLYKMLINTNSKRLKELTYHNMALAFEMEGQLDSALYYSTQSTAVFQNPVEKKYLRILEQRLKDQKKLSLQLK